MLNVFKRYLQEIILTIALTLIIIISINDRFPVKPGILSHILVYFILTFSVISILKKQIPGFMVTLIGGFIIIQILGLAIEFYQMILLVDVFELKKLVANAVGSFMGLIFFLLLYQVKLITRL